MVNVWRQKWYIALTSQMKLLTVKSFILVWQEQLLRSAIITINKMSNGSNISIIQNLLYKVHLEFKNQGCQTNLYVVLNQLFFISFTTSFVGDITLMNRPCYKNNFQFMQHDNFRNLNEVISTYWKLLQSELMPFDTCFQSLNDIPFTILWNRLPSQETRSPLKYCNCLITLRYQSFVILVFSSIVILIQDEFNGVSLV